ncbi:MAG: hypothetical protein KC451_08540 [Amylibacter sp.]|nr:hypothetical protein [Amylibacter sp.]
MEAEENCLNGYGFGKNMNIYLLSTGLSAIASSIKWSETKNTREILKDSDRWYSTDADRVPLGPFPAAIRHEVDQHWTLSLARNRSLPDTFMSLRSRHFTGAPFARKKVCDVFEEYSEGNFELFPIHNFWSLADKEEVPEQYFVANVFNAANVIDTKRSPLEKVLNPKVGYPNFLRDSYHKTIFVDRHAFQHRHLLRDTKTSDWFCDDVFKDAMERVTPRTYEFAQVMCD